MGNNLHDKINLNHLSIFVKLAQFTSLTEASKYLRQDKGQLSRILKTLEEDIGTTLIHRTTREFRLTANGKELYSRCKNLFNQIEENILDLESDVSDEPEGSIKLTASHGVTSAMLPNIIANYNKAFPKVSININFSQNLLRLDHEQIDLAIRMGNLPDSGLKVRKLADFGFGFYASPQFLITSPKYKNLSDLKKETTFVMSQLNEKKLTFKKRTVKKLFA